MAKDTRPAEPADGQASAKKRRVTKVTASPAEPVTPVKAPELDVYNQVVEFEEKEAKERNSEEDAQLYYATCNEIKDLLLEISELKSKNAESNAALIKEKRIQASLKILLLKKLNRIEKVRIKESRLALQKAREQVDSDHLHLQNMLYEVVHLTKEVKKCLEFKSKDEEMDLVPVDEFYATAPETISKPEVTKTNDHELKLARLQWELVQRKELALHCKSLEASKEAVGKEIESKKEQLNDLTPSLKAILDAMRPLQDNLGIQVDKTRKLHELALLLPKALYVLFVQADAYSHVVKWITATITGECDKSLTEELHLDDISSADSDSDNEGDLSHRRKVNFQDRRKSGINNPSDKIEQKKKECLKRHPLSVVLKISIPSGEVFSLEFQWLMSLEVVCVQPTVSGSEGSGIAGEDLISSRNILSSLFPGDTGETCPNSSAVYQLRRAGLDSFPGSNNSLGIPYSWAQQLCGIDFLSPTPEIKVKHCQNNLENILKLAKKRFSDRLGLVKEIRQLESGYSITHKKLSTVLSSFVTITLQDFSSLPSSKLLMKENIIDSTFIFYQAVLTSGAAKLNAYMAVSPNYPKHAPIFLLEFNYKGKANALTCNSLRDIERDINVYTDDKSDTEEACGLLTRQIRKLLYCTEIFVHTEYPDEVNAQSSTYFRGIQGRNRSHPYRYIAAAGGIYTHR